MQRPHTLESSDDPLSKWVHCVDRAIEAAQERGDFDNLPGHGKPLMLDEHPYAGDRALGFHVLNNAGIKPLWMELDKEIQGLRVRMQRLLDQVRGQAASTVSAPCPRPRDVSSSWMRRLITGERIADSTPLPDQGRERRRTAARREYLRLAADLDEKIRVYNHALPPELRHLERIRLCEADAARVFEAALPANRHPLSNRKDP